uniref:Uncharacterized protein n=1 Tax=Podoviridae sp. ctQyH19 TaxID=2825249 RepID=A0A8S5UQU3_9CAUD|nr:MAG TPA: hypothetical protein [Podoviridae sp. ctQyH19]
MWVTCVLKMYIIQSFILLFKLLVYLASFYCTYKHIKKPYKLSYLKV